MPSEGFSGMPSPHQDGGSRADNNNDYLADSVEPSGACTPLHFWANEGSWKDREERRGTRSRARGDLQYIVSHKHRQ
jgi:hypothetical protein